MHKVGRGQSEDLGVNGKITLEWIKGNNVGRRLDSFGSG
jgi:hypothetical protein